MQDSSRERNTGVNKYYEAKKPRAFPSKRVYSDELSDRGMFLRDYFAAQAMASLVELNQSMYGIAEIAELSYKYADAMLKERSLEPR